MRRAVEDLGFAPVDIPYKDVGKFVADKTQEYINLAKEAGIVPTGPRPK